MSIVYISTGLLFGFLFFLIGLIIIISWNFLLLRKSYHILKSNVSKVDDLQDQLEKVKGQLELAKQETLKVEDDYKKKLVISNLTVIDSEQRKIGANIHDFIGSMLWAIKVQLNVVTRKGEPNEYGILAIKKATEIMEVTLNNTRQAIQQLVPKTLLTKGLSEAVKEHCGYITSDKMSFEFSESGDRKLNSLCERQVVILFRIIQEILNNCVKYSEASTIVIHLDWGMQLFINVVNNGKAFQIDDCFKSNNQGVGMYNIIERVKAVGGSIISDAGPPNTIQIQVPADANA